MIFRLLPLLLVATGCALAGKSQPVQPPVNPIRHHHLPDPLEQAETMWKWQQAWEQSLRQQFEQIKRRKAPETARVVARPEQRERQEARRRLRRVARAASSRLFKRSLGTGSAKRRREQANPTLLGTGRDGATQPAEIAAKPTTPEAALKRTLVQSERYVVLPHNDDYAWSSAEKGKTKNKIKRIGVSTEIIPAAYGAGDSNPQLEEGG